MNPASVAQTRGRESSRRWIRATTQAATNTVHVMFVIRSCSPPACHWVFSSVWTNRVKSRIRSSVRSLIRHSLGSGPGAGRHRALYDRVMEIPAGFRVVEEATPFEHEVAAVVRAIPAGSVASYGRI